MAAWIIPAFKAILPHIGVILSAAVPVFTQKNANTVANRALMQEQITELQSAVSQNALHLKELAEQLQNTVTALEQAALIAEARQQRLLWVCLAAILVSLTSTSAVLYLVFMPN